MKAMQNESTMQDILKSIRNLLEDPNHWCQNNMAMHADGTYAAFFSDHATKWCLVGAVSRVVYEHKDEIGNWESCIWSSKGELLKDVLEKLHAALRFKFQDDNLDDWNDVKHRLHEDVLALLDAALLKTEDIYTLERMEPSRVYEDA